jgi:general secretion pathway protein E
VSVRHDLLESSVPLQGTFRPEYLTYYRLLPLARTADRVRVAAVGTPHPDALADLAATYTCDVEVIPVTAEVLDASIRRIFSAQTSVAQTVRDIDAPLTTDATARDDATADARDLVNQPPVIRFVNVLIREAADTRASDIHLEALRDGLSIRLRVDGVLSEVPPPPPPLWPAIVSRIKLLAQLDIAERRLPQDGRIRARLETRELDIRVSTVPTLFGESVVLRLLDQAGGPPPLEQLGMAPALLAQFRTLASRSHGMLLVTGPTGSGKTTTLYAALGLRHPDDEKIVTVEDPIEYHLPRVTQVPVQAKVGVHFATALRSILRQDPDVIMVGETRDAETASVATQAAMTGHLVLTTLHTNDALGAITRLRDLGVEPYLLAATLQGVLAQRLVRRICPTCRDTYAPDAGSLRSHFGDDEPPAVLYRGAGCAACRHTGYLGRLGIFELVDLSDSLRQLIAADADPAQLRAAAIADGFRGLADDARAKVRDGRTTLTEVLRVLGT